MSKWERDEKILVGGLGVIATLALGSLVAILINTATAEEIGRSEPFDYHYTYCSRMTYGPKAMSSCAEYKSAVEKRISIYMHGKLWDYNNYRVVR